MSKWSLGFKLYSVLISVCFKLHAFRFSSILCFSDDFKLASGSNCDKALNCNQKSMTQYGNQVENETLILGYTSFMFGIPICLDPQ